MNGSAMTVRLPCPVCKEPILVATAPQLTSRRTPDGKGVLVFMEVDRAKLDRHAATHLTEEEAAA